MKGVGRVDTGHGGEGPGSQGGPTGHSTIEQEKDVESLPELFPNSSVGKIVSRLTHGNDSIYVRDPLDRDKPLNQSGDLGRWLGVIDRPSDPKTPERR